MRPALPQYVLAFVVLVAGAGLLWAGSTSTAAFGGYNPTWDGSQDARVLADEEADVAVLQSTNGYGDLDPEDATAVVLSPTASYDDASLERVRAFVRNGGTLVVAGDFGEGVDGDGAENASSIGANELLAGVGAGTRVDGRVLRDERVHGATPAMPVATNVSESPYTDGVDRVALNYPSVLVPGEDARVVVESSAYSYVDENRNEALDDAESLASRPVIATEPVGDGTVVVVSDPSLFINTMLDDADNRALAANLFGTPVVAFDYSHAAGLPPLTALALWLRDSALAQLAVAAALLAGATAVMRGWRPVAALNERFGRDDATGGVGLSEREIVAFVQDRHPEWSRERVERLAQSINLPSRNDGGER